MGPDDQKVRFQIGTHVESGHTDTSRNLLIASVLETWRRGESNSETD
jgi:hypothetical protein